MNQLRCIIQFHFSSPLHIASAGADYDKSETSVHSDTLYAAIMHAWALLGKSDWIDQNYTFALSSLFPFYKQQNGFCYFLPKPTGTLQTGDVSQRKHFKKIKFVEASLYASLGNLKPEIEKIAGHFLLKNPLDETQRNAIKTSILTEVYPRVRVNKERTGEENEPFYIERIFFKDAGLYTIFQGSQEEYDKVKLALNLLEHEGIGTDRNVGNGHFTWKEETLPKNFFGDELSGNYYVNLSLFLPKDEEQLSRMLKDEKEKTAYELVKRGGWITNEPFLSLRKKSVYMFKAGSIFTGLSSQEIVKGIGNTVNVCPEYKDSNLHNIWRIGRSLFVPINL